MFTKIKGLWYSITGNYPIQHLVNTNDNIVDIFTKTINSLKENNSLIDRATINRSHMIAKLQDERDNLNKIINTNENVISKIEKLFE